MKKIAFVVYYPYQWYIYKNIYNAISYDKRFVIVDLGAQPEIQDANVRRSILELLDKENVAYSILDKNDYNRPGFLKSFFSKIEVIVSCWEIGCVGHSEVKDIKKVCTTYGIAKELTFLRPSRSIYDVILAYGDRDRDYFSLLTRSIAIGNPRLDKYYNNVNIGLDVRFEDNTKKKILYVPTHGDLGSAGEMIEIIKKTSEKYNIIFKPHYYSLREELATLDIYKKMNNVVVIDDSFDIIEVMAKVDVIVSDNSSAIFDAIQINKPLIVCDFIKEDFLDTAHKKLRILKRGVVGATTYSGSIEQEIKRNDLVLTIKRPKELIAILENIDSLDIAYKKKRESIIKKHFKYTDGSSSLRAAQIINNLYDSQRNHQYGILHHAYLAYNGRLYRSLLEKKENVISTEEVIVWIIYTPRSTQEEIRSSIYSVLSEKSLKKIYVSGSENISIEKEYMDKVSFLPSSDVTNEICKDFKNEVILIVKPNTKIESIDLMIKAKNFIRREILFFAENILFNSKSPTSNLFFLLKKEILNLNLHLKETIINVNFEQITSISKSAILVNSEVVTGIKEFILPESSFEDICDILIATDRLKYSSFLLMPDFLKNNEKSDNLLFLDNLISAGVKLSMLDVPVSRWPEVKITNYLSKILTCNFQYFILLKFILLKIIRVKLYKATLKVIFILSSLKIFLNKL